MPTARVLRSEERFSRNAETDLVCRLLLEKKKREHGRGAGPGARGGQAAGGGRRAAGQGAVPCRRGADRGGRGHRTGQRGVVCFFFNDTATTEIYPLSLHDALPI